MSTAENKRQEAIDLLAATDDVMGGSDSAKGRSWALHTLIDSSFTDEEWKETAAKICYERRYDCLSENVTEHFRQKCPNPSLADLALLGRLEDFGLAASPVTIDITLLHPAPPKKKSVRSGAQT